jgi:hypothetical protein
LPQPLPPPETTPPANFGPAPRSAPEPDGGLKLEPDVIALPEAKKEKDTETQYWVLDPLRIDLRDGCGVAQVTATMTLSERIADGVYRGTVRNTIRSQRCKASGGLYVIELRIAGSEVTMIGAGGISDRGVMGNGVMMLEDAYGRSVWRKR